MKENTVYILFSVLRSIFHSNQMNEADKQLVTDDLVADVIKLASKHDIAHLIALGLLNNDLVADDTKSKLQHITFRAVYRYEKLNYELQRICEVFEKANIKFIPLKGSVIRQYYPESWMRTSCDIDVLVNEKDLKTAVSCLVENLKYSGEKCGSHDVSLFSQNGVHIELHYNLLEDGRVNDSSMILADVWKTSYQRDANPMWHEMSDEMFYFYHIVHMAKHFENGGCGVRPFIDLWILDNIQDVDIEKRNSLLRKGKLLQFADSARKLSKSWIENQSMDSVTEKMQNYIIQGGVYGSSKNRITIQQQKRGGCIKYAMSKVILSYDTIKFQYPIIQKHRWLTPFMQVRRWFKLIFGGHAKRSMRELSYNSNISQSQADEMKIFLEEIGL